MFLTGGYYPDPSFGFEATYGTTQSDNNLKFDRIISADVVARYFLGNTGIYGRVNIGVANTSLKYEVTGETETSTGMSFGMGGGFQFKGFDINAQYFDKGGDMDYRGYSVAVGYHF